MEDGIKTERSNRRKKLLLAWISQFIIYTTINGNIEIVTIFLVIQQERNNYKKILT